MKKLFRFLAILLPLIFFWGCTSLPFDTGASDDELRVVSWNIEWFPGQSLRASPERQERHRQEVREYLPKLKADILLLQEIRNAEAAQFLADSLPGMKVDVATAFSRGGELRGQQLVIISRLPARAGFAEVFTGIYDDPDTEPYRGFAFAALEHPTLGLILVYNVHLKSNLGERERVIAMREESARQILLHIEQMTATFADEGPLPVIVGGDFNLLLNREEMAHERTLQQFLDAGFHWTWAGVPFQKRVTWPALGNFSDACFDHILTRGLPEVTAKVLHKPAYRLSDHRPVKIHIKP
jgi:endonuclease/exonuclease/phosphatase family metal-dependent hydrolase